MTPEQRAKAIQAIQAGEVAAAFYDEHPFEEARLQIMREWSLAETAEDREALWHERKALDRVVNLLKAVARNAKAGAIEIKAAEDNQTVRIDPYGP